MTTNYMGISLNNLNNNQGNITVGTSAQSTDFNFSVLTTYSPTKQQCLMALEAFRNYILANGVPAGNKGVDLPVL